MAKSVLFIGGPWHNEMRAVRNNGPILAPVIPEDVSFLDYLVVEYIEFLPISDGGFIDAIYAPRDLPNEAVMPALAYAVAKAITDLQLLKSTAHLAVEAMDVSLSGVEYYKERNSQYFVRETRDKLKQAIANSNSI